MASLLQQSNTWHPLPLTSASAPSSLPLLVKTVFTPRSYTVYITDLCQLWHETLDRAAILRRAAEEETTIDPSEDASQLMALLEKIEGALLRPQRDVKELSLVPGDNGMRLRLRCELPHPLPELRWHLELEKGSMVDFTNVFVMPLVAGQGLLKEQVESLKETVKGKDQVIEKLTDALEDNKVRVDVIVGPRRKKALASFDVEAWERGFGSARQKSGNEVVEEVFVEGEKEVAARVKPFEQDAADWWKDLHAAGRQEDADVGARRRKTVSTVKKEPEKRQKERVESETEDEDDGFKRLKTPSPPPRREKESKTETDSGEDLPPPRQLPHHPKKSVGKIGGKGKTKSSTPPPPVKNVTVADEGEETASEEDLDAGIYPPTPQPPKVVSEAKPPAVKRTIGKIGGRRSAPASPSPPRPLPPPPPAAAEGPKAEGVKKKSIGKIGGNRKALAESTVQKGQTESPEMVGSTLQTQTLSPPSRYQPTKPQTPELELDEDEKADRKRRQLEEELEAKKKAPPKKKRKF